MCGPCHGGTSAQRGQRGCSCGLGIHAYGSGGGCLVEMCASRRSLSDVSSQRPGGKMCPDGRFLWTDQMRLGRAGRVSQPQAPGTFLDNLTALLQKRPICHTDLAHKTVVPHAWFSTVGLLLTVKRQRCKLLTPSKEPHLRSVRRLSQGVFVPFPTC